MYGGIASAFGVGGNTTIIGHHDMTRDWMIEALALRRLARALVTAIKDRKKHDAYPTQQVEQAVDKLEKYLDDTKG